MVLFLFLFCLLVFVLRLFLFAGQKFSITTVTIPYRSFFNLQSSVPQITSHIMPECASGPYQSILDKWLLATQSSSAA